MKKVHNNLVIAEVSRGQVITGAQLTQMARAINSNTRYLSGPRQQGALEVTENENANTSGNLDLDFVESSRQNTTVEFTDSNGDTHNAEQIDLVTMVNSAGQVMTLTFNN